MKKIVLLSDTHSHIDDRILHFCQGADEIWHAGDLGSLTVTDALKQVAPVRAVYGNIDGQEIRREWPLHQLFEIEGLKVWMTHIGGRPGRYVPKVREQMLLIQPGLFICGHSHILLAQYYPKGKHLHLNPGAAGVHGFHKVRTLMRFDVSAGEVKNLEAVELGAR